MRMRSLPALTAASPRQQLCTVSLCCGAPGCPGRPPPLQLLRGHTAPGSRGHTIPNSKFRRLLQIGKYDSRPGATGNPSRDQFRTRSVGFARISAISGGQLSDFLIVWCGGSILQPPDGPRGCSSRCESTVSCRTRGARRCLPCSCPRHI
jgi:hypothetical protein